MSAPDVSPARPALPRALIAGPVVVIVALAVWALFVLQSNKETHSYNHGDNPPPANVELKKGATYGVALHGGVAREVARGLVPGTLQCTATKQGQAPGPLQVNAEAQGTKATDRIGWFVAEFGGRVHVECAGIGTVFIDNAEDAGFDWSGVWLVLASVLLAIGLPLTLSGLRRAGRRVDPAAAGGFEFERHGEAHMVAAGPRDDLHAQWQPPVAEPERDLGRG
jgi:hypothetical protein